MDLWNLQTVEFSFIAIVIKTVSQVEKKEKLGNKHLIDFILWILLTVVPKVEVFPRSVTEMEGGNVKAVCSASGSPFPVIQWNPEMLSTKFVVR